MLNNMHIVEYVTWGEVNAFKTMVCQYVHEHDLHLAGVYGLPRGGLVPAVMLSYELDIPLLLSPVKNCLIVDDICDSGESLMHFAKNSSNPLARLDYLIATMYYNEKSLEVKPDLFLKKKQPGDCWVVFPWEQSPVENLYEGEENLHV